ncbi:hypothetical protein BS78_06G032400 [Paspalum vaginatum]|nr:hypothetical protein BS78_06G032400 [Paspalum vaginatum]
MPERRRRELCTPGSPVAPRARCGGARRWRRLRREVVTIPSSTPAPPPPDAPLPGPFPLDVPPTGPASARRAASQGPAACRSTVLLLHALLHVAGCLGERVAARHPHGPALFPTAGCLGEHVGVRCLHAHAPTLLRTTRTRPSQERARAALSFMASLLAAARRSPMTPARPLRAGEAASPASFGLLL